MPALRDKNRGVTRRVAPLCLIRDIAGCWKDRRYCPFLGLPGRVGRPQSPPEFVGVLVGATVGFGGTGVAIAGTGVAVAGTGVAIAGTGVAVGGIMVGLVGTGVLVAVATCVGIEGAGVAVGTTGVAVAGTEVAVGGVTWTAWAWPWIWLWERALE